MTKIYKVIAFFMFDNIIKNDIIYLNINAIGTSMYDIKWTKKAQKQLKRLEKRHQEKLIAMADSLKENPHRKNTIKMKGFENKYRLKQGAFRVVYSIYDTKLVVEVLKAGFREGIYR